MTYITNVLPDGSIAADATGHEPYELACGDCSWTWSGDDPKAWQHAASEHMEEVHGA